MCDREVLEARKILERNVVHAVYVGTYNIDEIATAFPRVSKKLVAGYVKEITPGLEDTDSSLALTRACNKVCGLKEKQTYTREEQRQAVYEYNRTKFSKTKRDIENDYGISASALKRLSRQLRDVCDRAPTDNKLKETANTISIAVSGQQLILERRRECDMARYRQAAWRRGRRLLTSWNEYGRPPACPCHR